MKVTLDCASAGSAGVSRTRQSEAHKTDLNSAIAKYRKSGILAGPLANLSRKGQYVDLSDAPTYLEARTAILASQKAFDALPAKLRERFGNDAYKLLEFLQNPKNLNEAVTLGLLEKVEAKVQGEPEPIINEKNIEPAN